MVEILGLPVAAGACSARSHDVVARRELQASIDGLPRLQAIVGDRAYSRAAPLPGRAWSSTSRSSHQARPDPLRRLVKVEHAFAQLCRWRRLSRCYEGTVAGARAWHPVAAVGYLAWRTAV